MQPKGRHSSTQFGMAKNSLRGNYLADTQETNCLIYCRELELPLPLSELSQQMKLPEAFNLSKCILASIIKSSSEHLEES